MIQYKTHDIKYTIYTDHNTKIKHTNSFAVVVGQGVVEEGLISFGS